MSSANVYFQRSILSLEVGPPHLLRNYRTVSKNKGWFLRPVILKQGFPGYADIFLLLLLLLCFCEAEAVQLFQAVVHFLYDC